MIRKWKLSMGLVFTLLFQAPLVWAQKSSIDDLKEQIEELSQTVKAMQKDLHEIKALLLGRAPAAPPENVVLDVSNHPFQGEPTAKLTLIEFSDYQ